MAKIVIADDEEFVRFYLKGLLEHAGHEIVAEVSNGENLFETLKDANANILILDINMPNLKGNEFLREYGKTFRDVCVIILTISTASVIKAELLDMGYNYFIRKDTEPEELLNNINSYWKDFMAHKG